MKRPLFLTIMLAWTVLLTVMLSPTTGWSHPADQYFQAHHITVSDSGIELEWSITPGPLMVNWIWHSADSDGNRQVSEAEARSWWVANVPTLTVMSNDQPLAWTLGQVRWPHDISELQTGDIPITARLTSHTQSPISFPLTLTLTNRLYEKTSVCWFSIRTENGIRLHKPQQQNSYFQIELVRYPLTGSIPESGAVQHAVLTAWDSGTPALRWTSRKVEATAIEKNATKERSLSTKAYETLKDFLNQKSLSAAFLLFAFIISVILGALHAVTPGHGKTIVAAYLVGSKGTVGHAVVLGAIVTATHTGSVFLLGLLVLTASDYFLPTQIFPVLEISSGLLIVGLGVYLLVKRWRLYKGDSNHVYHHSHHQHSHHSHHHHYHHHHDVSDHSSDISWRSLTTLGISGGLVPCPDAIAILLLAVAIKRIALGLMLIIGFSMGLAVVLTAIGIVMVQTGRLLKKGGRMESLVPIIPVVSAVVVLIIGVCLTLNAGQNIRAQMVPPNYTVASRNTANPQNYDAKRSNPLVFDIENARIVYLDRDSQNNPQLFAASIGSKATQSLSREPFGVFDYAVAPDGLTVVYSTRNESGGSEIRLYDVGGEKQRVLLECRGKSCGRPVWSPDGKRITYESTSPPSNQMPRGIISLRSYHVESGTDSPVLHDPSISSFNASWSGDGRWFGYATNNDQQIRLCDLVDGDRHMIPNSMGTPVFWHPDSRKLLFLEPAIDAAGIETHLFLFDMMENASKDLSDGSHWEDSFASWSPHGRWIALLRRKSNESGNQLYLMDENGKSVRQLTHDSEIIHGAPVWSPDGTHILFHRQDLRSSSQPSICLLEMKTGKAKIIVQSGSQPNWIRNTNRIQHSTG